MTDTTLPANHERPHAPSSQISLLVAATGVVYGDIGTSPLYTLKEVFAGHYGVQVNHDGVLGILSLVFWALMLTGLYTFASRVL